MGSDERLDRLDSIEAIRQLAARYALAVDVRDLDALVELYVDDIRVGEARGRQALKEVFDRSLRQFTASFHLVGNHVIEFDDPDNARGVVYCRVEHEVVEVWVTAALMYHDRYQRRDGCWYIRGRSQQRLYAAANDDPPVGVAKIRWPGAEPVDGRYHDPFPSWDAFWGGPAPAPAEADAPFLARIRRTKALPAPPKYIF